WALNILKSHEATHAAHLQNGISKEDQRNQALAGINLLSLTRVRSRGSNSTTPPQIVPIDVDVIDDDVILSSPRSFAEAKKNSRRSRGGVLVVDLDAGSWINKSCNVICNAETSSSHLNDRNMNSRAPRHQQVINLESRTANLRERGGRHQEQVALPPPPPPTPKEPVFSCPVCIGPLVEEVSTKCGHIFCKACITTAIAVQKKCPTCRSKMTMKDTIRVFLPKARSDPLDPFTTKVGPPDAAVVSDSTTRYSTSPQSCDSEYKTYREPMNIDVNSDKAPGSSSNNFSIRIVLQNKISSGSDSSFTLTPCLYLNNITPDPNREPQSVTHFNASGFVDPDLVAPNDEALLVRQTVLGEAAKPESVSQGITGGLLHRLGFNGGSLGGERNGEIGAAESKRTRNCGGSAPLKLRGGPDPASG
ncbi:hypothetical protein V2J09_002137, partial [Rumex salicifolius]